eukprot:UN06007
MSSSKPKSGATSKSKLEYKPIDIEFDDDDDMKAPQIETRRSTEGILDPYSPNAIKSKRSSSPSPPNASDIVHSDMDESSNFLQIELTLRQLMHQKIAICRNESNTSTSSTNLSNMCTVGTVSSNDVNAKNIIFSNPPPQTLRLQVNRENRENRKNTVSQSSETSVSIQTNSNETSAGTTSYDMFVSPIKPSVYLNGMND